MVGSALIGQSFTSDGYFRGRPSATTKPDPNDASKTVDEPYNAANSMGSNLGPTNKALIERVQGDVDKLKAENGSARVPIDLVTTTGSGLDPHISPEAALFQVPRVAKARNLSEDRCASSSISTSKDACSACSANRASTWLPSTWRWTGCAR